MTPRTLLMVPATLVAGLALAGPAHAAPFTVTNTSDSGAGSLEDAIDDANLAPGADDISFDIPGSGPHTIALTTALPDITDAVTIDGSTGSDAAALAPVKAIYVDGGGTIPGGLTTMTGGVVIRGLAIGNFQSTGIAVTSGSATIEGNFLGTDETGLIDRGNGAEGVFVASGTFTVIGGVTPAQRNVIAGNEGDGILIFSDLNDVEGNFIGVGRTGAPLGNGDDGVELGTSAAGNEIGGTAVAESNTIASNAGAGVEVTGTADDNSIRRNRIFGNGALGIDLGADGVTPNDPADPDPGPNALQNFPVIGAATATAFGDTVSGTLNSQVDTYAIEVFVSSSCDASGNGEGATPFGSPVTVSADGSGNATFQVSGTGINPGDAVTAVATDTTTGATSEFSACKTALAPPFADLVVSLVADDATPEPGEPFTYTATLTNLGPAVAVAPSMRVTLPESVRRLSAPGCSAAGQVVTCASPNLASGAFLRRQIQVRPTRSGSLTATVTGSSSTSDPGGASATSSVLATLPRPSARRQANVRVVKGRVRIKQPGQRSFRDLEGEDQIRIGSLIDTTDGRVRLTTSAGGGKTQTAQFYDGLFKLTQTGGRRPITDLTLRGKLAGCSGKSASAAARKRRGRRLWGNGRGRFRSRGRRSAALVRGTIWLVEDRCNGTTFTRVRKGVVQVRDFKRRRNVRVRSGRTYTAPGRP